MTSKEKAYWYPLELVLESMCRAVDIMFGDSFQGESERGGGPDRPLLLFTTFENTYRNQSRIDAFSI